MKYSRPLIYGSLVVVAVGALWYANEDTDSKAPAVVVKPRTADVNVESDLIQADYTASFEKSKASLRNVFVPLLQAADDKPVVTLAKPPEDLDHIPANLANGEASWLFTGLAEVDGAAMALLENTTTHQGGFVKQGEVWKSSRLVRITSESVVLRDSKTGIDQVVLRYDPNKPSKPKTPADVPALPPAAAAVNPNMQGPIGPGNLQINPINVGRRSRVQFSPQNP